MFHAEARIDVLLRENTDGESVVAAVEAALEFKVHGFELPEPIRGICPEGFHLPTDDEWNVLFAKVGGNERTGKETAGKALKSQSGWKNSGYVGVGGNGTDAYGFSAMPVGGWEGLSFSDDDGVYAFFWSASEGGTDTAYRNRLGNGYDAAALYAYSKANGYSIRCLKD